MRMGGTSPREALCAYGMTEIDEDVFGFLKSPYDFSSQQDLVCRRIMVASDSSSIRHCRSSRPGNYSPIFSSKGHLRLFIR